MRITSADISGCGLHMHERRTAMQAGRVFGHQNLGAVIEVGPAVDRIEVGDRVRLPFSRDLKVRRHEACPAKPFRSFDVARCQPISRSRVPQDV
ncbi:MAG TPA: alcohol dehydrogenase catalytic domain-containing protein [Burkholderiaceae bacterium]